MEERGERRGESLVFAVNGERFELFSVDPSITVLQFLRSHTTFKGTKLSCGEGGCGACVVLLSKYDPEANQVENFTISSCLTLLCSVDRCSITTTEGLGNSKDGFHPIHQRMAGFHASQCGFCTPGMSVSLFSAIVNAETKPRPIPPKGFSKLTSSEAEKAISGNLCRCTGYRPITDVCKSFASDVDIEDLGMNSFWKKTDSSEEKANKLPYYDPNDQICTFPKFLKNEINFSLPLKPKNYPWLNPVSIKELLSMLDSNLNDKRVKLVVGNTGTGYYKEIEKYDEYVNLSFIPELSMIRRDEVGFEIGATVTISKVIEALREEFNSQVQSLSVDVFRKIADHMEKIASGFIRNSGTIGGNLVMAQRNHFPSDIATILVCVNSTVNIVTNLKHEQISVEEFLTKPPLSSKSVVLSIQIPSWKKARKNYKEKSNKKLLFETYRASPRPLGNALAYLNAAFLAEVTPREDTNGAFIGKVRLCFGAYGTKHAIRVKKVEEYLSGKEISIDLLCEAMRLVRSSIVPDVGTPHGDYRATLAVGFLFKFFHCFIEDRVVLSNGSLDGCQSDLTNEDREIVSDFEQKNDNCVFSLSGRQVVEIKNEYYPAGEPITKAGAAIQASGEAVYVDDIPSPTNCLHGAFIYSTKPLAKVKIVEIKSTSSKDGVAEVISFKDIPDGGENVGSKTIFGTEPLFSDDITRFAGERIAFVVANTQKLADVAAESASIDYYTNELEAPILTVEEAVEKKSFFQVPPFLCPSQVGDFSRGMAEADLKILSAEIKLGSQYHFYMETQTALAVPDEDNCMVIYSSIQSPEYAHTVIAKCLGIPEHNVRVITRRVGGGFGGKALRAMPVATACALAAHKLRRPVRVYVNRKTDMVMAGGRHPMKITYTVGFKSSGKITALHLDILINAGLWADISPSIPSNMIGSLKKYDWGALSFDIKLCKTNHSTKTAMRAPGEPQATFIAESVIEHVASILQTDVDSVRNKNLHSFQSLNTFYTRCAGEASEYTLPNIWDKLATSSCYQQRFELIKTFNFSNKWKKRGISRVPIVHEVSLRATPGKVSILSDGSVVVEVGGIEIGQGLWTKVQQMTVYALSSILCEGAKVSLDKVRVIQADTLSMIQGGFTAGSTTSESSCEAVRLCCNILVERLGPIKEKLQNTTGTVTWEALIQQAQMQSVNLSAHSYYVPDFTSMKYLNYGAAVSEVEVDLLTGETRILQSDIIYDCGQSLNPAVDLGQIEGSFVQGIGFFMLEEYTTNSDGLVTTEGTWTYKIPTIDTIPQKLNVEILNSGHHQKRVLSSKASGEPPLLLAVSVHCATRAAIIEARKQLNSWKGVDNSELAMFHLEVPATMPIVKEACGLDYVETYLKSLLANP